MLASLLPGLRDVRTPLVVGYLWLTCLWVILGGAVPQERPPGDGLIARLFDLAAILPASVPIAALSFIAYVLGALLTIPLEGALGRLLSPSNMSPLLFQIVPSAREAWETNHLYRNLLFDAANHFGVDFDPTSKEPGQQFVTDIELRTRLLVANQELYGEYDRLAAESAFRLNLILPLVLLATTIPPQARLWGWPLTLLVIVALAAQGLSRHLQAWSVLRRAVIEDVITDPTISRWSRDASAAGPG